MLKNIDLKINTRDNTHLLLTLFKCVKSVFTILRVIYFGIEYFLFISSIIGLCLKCFCL